MVGLGKNILNILIFYQSCLSDGTEKVQLFFIIIDNKTKVCRACPILKMGRDPPHFKKHQIKNIEKHKTEGNVEKARISGVERGSLYFKQFLLTLKLKNHWPQVVHSIEEGQLGRVGHD